MQEVSRLLVPGRFLPPKSKIFRPLIVLVLVLVAGINFGRPTILATRVRSDRMTPFAFNNKFTFAFATQVALACLLTGASDEPIGELLDRIRRPRVTPALLAARAGS